MQMEQGMAGEVAIVRQSFERCYRHADFADVFYDRFAHQTAEIATLFADTNMEKQNLLLREGILSLIGFAEGREDAEQQIRDLALSHGAGRHDIRPDLYPPWVEALIESVRECDADCNTEPQIETAWRNVVAPGVTLIVSLY